MSDLSNSINSNKTFVNAFIAFIIAPRRNGKWKIENRERKMENGKWMPSGKSCQFISTISLQLNRNEIKFHKMLLENQVNCGKTKSSTKTKTKTE